MSQINEYVYALPEDYNLTGDTNDLEFSSTYVHLTSGAAYNLTGMQAPITDDHVAALLIENEGSFNITLKHDDSSSSVGNRFWSGTLADVVLAPGKFARVIKAGNYYWIQQVFG